MVDENKKLVRKVAAKGISSERVLNAMAQVDRRHFVPDQYKRRIYDDNPLPIGAGQTISQPYIVAFMTEKLDVRNDDKVLEIGTGSGYQLAILSKLAASVYSVERSPELITQAKKNLEAADCRDVVIKEGDGYEGMPEVAPFDRIILTAAAVHIPPPLLNQLVPQGRMILPIGGVNEIQTLTLVKKYEDGKVTQKPLESVRFVPMTGRAQERRVN